MLVKSEFRLVSAQVSTLSHDPGLKLCGVIGCVEASYGGKSITLQVKRYLEAFKPNIVIY